MEEIIRQIKNQQEINFLTQPKMNGINLQD